MFTLKMKTALIILFAFYCFAAEAQFITPTVQNSGSVDVRTAKVRYSFVVGQSFVALNTSKAKANLVENMTVGKLYAGAVTKTVNTKSNINIRLYPNPVADHVKISINNKAEGQVFDTQIMDMLGRVVAHKQSADAFSQEETFDFDVSSFAPGQYLCRTYPVGDPQNAHVFKLVKIPN